MILRAGGIRRGSNSTLPSYSVDDICVESDNLDAFLASTVKIGIPELPRYQIMSAGSSLVNADDDEEEEADDGTLLLLLFLLFLFLPTACEDVTEVELMVIDDGAG